MSDKAIEAAARALADNVADEVGLPRSGKIIPGNYSDAQAAIRAYLAAKEAEGFVMVPVEATEAMVEAMNLCRWLDFDMPDYADAYRAMIAARPQIGGNT